MYSFLTLELETDAVHVIDLDARVFFEVLAQLGNEDI
jgi:hypothetical protein